MNRKQILMEYYELKKQLIEQIRNQKIEEKFEILVIGEPRVKKLKRKNLQKMTSFV